MINSLIEVFVKKLFLVLLLFPVLVLADIVTSEVIQDRAQGNGLRKIRERHVDHLGKEYFVHYRADAAHDTNASLIAHASQINDALIDQEVQKSIAVYENGGDPLHFEESPNNWQRITPEYQTWEELAGAVTKDFLAREDKIELRFIQTTITRISSQTKATLWGTNVPGVSNVNAAIQEAVNMQIEQDAYTPFIVDGNFQ